jgi:hypothetical protein
MHYKLVLSLPLEARKFIRNDNVVMRIIINTF